LTILQKESYIPTQSEFTGQIMFPGANMDVISEKLIAEVNQK